MNILNSIQSREYKRVQALAGFFNEEKETCLLYQPFNDEVGSFFSNNKKLLNLAPDRVFSGKVITGEKGDLKTTIAINANVICTRTAAYAIKTGNKDLLEAVYRRTSEIGQLRDADVLAFATRLSDTVSPLVANADFLPYAVTADMLATVTKDATDFNNSIGKASQSDSKTSQVSTEIDQVLKDIRGNIVQFNLLLNFFEKDYSGFVKGYTTAIAIDTSGIRHSGIKGIILNSATGQPAEKVIVTLTGKKKTKSTVPDEEGAYAIREFLPGKCKLTITAPGCQTYTADISIVRGKTLELNVELQSQSMKMETA